MRTTSISTATAATIAALCLMGTGCGSDSLDDPLADSVGDSFGSTDRSEQEHASVTSWTSWSASGGVHVSIMVDVGSGCGSLDGVSIEEAADAVTILAYADTQPFADCTTEWVTEQVILTLDAPLGDRALLGCLPDDPDAECRVTPI